MGDSSIASPLQFRALTTALIYFTCRQCGISNSSTVTMVTITFFNLYVQVKSLEIIKEISLILYKFSIFFEEISEFTWQGYGLKGNFTGTSSTCSVMPSI